MSTSMSNFRRSAQDHFEPENNLDPADQRRLRGQLEQIDYTAFASNKSVIAARLGRVDTEAFQRLGVAAAEARARWVAAGIEISAATHAADPQDIARLTALKAAYVELSDVYEGMRRMVERGYLPFPVK